MKGLVQRVLVLHQQNYPLYSINLYDDNQVQIKHYFFSSTLLWFLFARNGIKNFSWSMITLSRSSQIVGQVLLWVMPQFLVALTAAEQSCYENTGDKKIR